MRASAKKIKKEPTLFPYFTKDMSRLILLFIPPKTGIQIYIGHPCMSSIIYSARSLPIRLRASRRR